MAYTKITDISSLNAWDLWLDFQNPISDVTLTLPTPDATESQEIWMTFTTSSTVNSPFWRITVPSGYYLLDDYANPTILPNIVYQVSFFNLGQSVTVDGNTYSAIGLIVYPWDKVNAS